MDWNINQIKYFVFDLDDTLSFSCKPISKGMICMLNELIKNDMKIAIVTMQSKEEIRDNFITPYIETTPDTISKFIFFTSCCTEIFTIENRADDILEHIIFKRKMSSNFLELQKYIQNTLDRVIKKYTIRVRNNVISIGLSSDEDGKKRKLVGAILEEGIGKIATDFRLFKKNNCRSMHVIERGYTKKNALRYLFYNLGWQKEYTLIIADDYNGMDRELICEHSYNISVGNLEGMSLQNVKKTFFQGPQMTYSVLNEILENIKKNVEPKYRIISEPEEFIESIEYIYKLIKDNSRYEIPVVCSVSKGADKFSYFLKKRFNSDTLLIGPSINISRDFGMSNNIEELRRWCNSLLDFLKYRYEINGSWKNVITDNYELVSKKIMLDEFFSHRLYNNRNADFSDIINICKQEFKEVSDIIQDVLIQEDTFVKGWDWNDKIAYYRYSAYTVLLKKIGWKADVGVNYSIGFSKTKYRIFILDDSLSFGRVGFFVSIAKKIMPDLRITFYVDSCPIIDCDLGSNHILPDFCRNTTERMIEDVFWMAPIEGETEKVNVIKLKYFLEYVHQFEMNKYRELSCFEPFMWMESLGYCNPQDYLGMMAVLAEKDYVDRKQMFAKLFSLDDIRKHGGYINGIRADYWIQEKIEVIDNNIIDKKLQVKIEEHKRFKEQQDYVLKLFFKKLFNSFEVYFDCAAGLSNEKYFFCTLRGFPSYYIIKEMIKNEFE